MKLRTLDTVGEARALAGLLTDYVLFVTSDFEAATGVSVDPAGLIDKTLASLETCVPPHGRTFVAEDDAGMPLGMTFLRPSGAEAMEIKRLYVRPEARGTGAGRALVEAAMASAREAGRSVMRLDTSRNLTGAIGLYTSLGFALREPYPESDHYGDEALLPYLVFMEKRL